MKSEIDNLGMQQSVLDFQISKLIAERDTLKAQRDALREALANLLNVAGVRIDDPRIKQFDAAREALALCAKDLR